MDGRSSRATVITDRGAGDRRVDLLVRSGWIAFRAATANRRRDLAIARSGCASASGASARWLRSVIARARSSTSDDRFDETTHVRPQLVADAVARPARPHVAAVTGVPSEKRAFSRNVTIQVRPSGVEPPGRRQAGRDTSLAVDADQRLVELTEQQPLALVRRVRCVRWIDAVAERDGRNRFARFSDQRAVDGSGLGTGAGVAGGGWRLWRGGNRTRVLAAGPAVAGRALPPGCARAAGPSHRLKADDEPERGESSTHQLHVFRPVVESVEPDARADREGTRQELHHTERLAAAQRRAAVSAHQGTAGSDAGRGVGGEQRRSQRKRRLSVRQAAAAPDRWTDSLSHQTD